MGCPVCGSSTEMWVWVRPAIGGSREALFVCDSPCKALLPLVLKEKGLIEDAVLRGWDVFIPIRLDDE
jgi:hypothetical protein